MKSEFIEGMRDGWSQEFAVALNVKHRPEHDEIVAMSCYTMVYHIADNFREGEFRTEILKHFGVE